MSNAIDFREAVESCSSVSLEAKCITTAKASTGPAICPLPRSIGSSRVDDASLGAHLYPRRTLAPSAVTAQVRRPKAHASLTCRRCTAWCAG